MAKKTRKVFLFALLFIGAAGAVWKFWIMNLNRYQWKSASNSSPFYTKDIGYALTLKGSTVTATKNGAPVSQTGQYANGKIVWTTATYGSNVWTKV